MAAAGLATLVLSVGCASTPRAPAGSTGGRMDPMRSTVGDLNSSRASAPAMLEFSDQVVQSFARDAVGLPEVASVGGDDRHVLALGALENRTGTPDSDFDLISTRIRSRMVGSTLIRSKFRVIQDPNVTDRDRAYLSGRTDGVDRYDPATTWVLQGQFYESNRGSTRRYYFTFSLTNLATNEIVFVSDYDLGQS